MQMKDLQCNFDGSGVVGWGSALDSAETRRALVVEAVVVAVAFSSFPIAGGGASCGVVGEWPPDGVEGKLTSEAVVFGGDAAVDQVSPPIEGIGFPMT